jgi:hypothetical protein
MVCDWDEGMGNPGSRMTGPWDKPGCSDDDGDEDCRSNGDMDMLASVQRGGSCCPVHVQDCPCCCLQ